MNVARPNSFRQGPDARGHFGAYGGRYVAETLMPLILDLEASYNAAKHDQAFVDELNYFLEFYVGRPSPLYFAERLTQHLGGAKIYLKRDELNHTGAHKINNCIGQILLARRMGKTRIIAETGAGQHGVATATVAARFGLPCVVYMGAVDMERQKPNVFRMKLLGAEVIPVTSGAHTLKDAMNEALRDWVANVHDTFYCIGTVAGPHPYPAMVRDFQSVIGNETRDQLHKAEGRLPDLLVAAIGGGSNAMGLFHPFLDDPSVAMHGVEAAGHGIDTNQHAASLTKGTPGILHGNKTYLLQDGDGQIIEAHSISAGLDYPGVGPEHAWLRDLERVTYVSATDDEALSAFKLCARLEGILPALEPAHALAHVIKTAPNMAADKLIVMNMCGRGDKDIFTVAEALKVTLSSRIAARFAALKTEGRAAFIPYVSAGDPDAETCAAILNGLPGAGADLIELGMPFTDPMADGPAVQKAGLRALKAGGCMKMTLELVRGFRAADSDTPIVLMGYCNPIHAYGIEAFARDAAAAGVDGAIVVDLPPEESDEFGPFLKAAGIDMIRLSTPTTSNARLPAVLHGASGFLYYVSIAGVTGTKDFNLEDVAREVGRIKRQTDLPVGVGFGIKTRDHAASIARFADAAVVGSAIVARIGEHLDADGKGSPDCAASVLDFVSDLSAGVRAARR